KANLKPKQTQYKANSNPIYRVVASGEAGSKPISKAKKSCRLVQHPGRHPGKAAMIKFVTVSLTWLCIDGNLSPLKLKDAYSWNYPGL
ncbi:MAG: hypothetical protein ACYS32_13210, partial [Planctomycetota bacterium]